jgi:hypothetical protein
MLMRLVQLTGKSIPYVEADRQKIAMDFAAFAR